MLIREKATPLDDSGTEKSPSNADDKSQLPKAGERIPEDDGPNAHNLDQTTRSPPDSPVGINAIESRSKELQDPRTSKNINVNGSPHAFETHRYRDYLRPYFSVVFLGSSIFSFSIKVNPYLVA
ncbi:intersectin-1 [Abeliophyllum distichum]|uniref:Intersectin-1 n=1 Tax=Abeliophyllum distichum TaxID=126358 RepID=A0ABD1SG53_9LAMI